MSSLPRNLLVYALVITTGAWLVMAVLFAAAATTTGDFADWLLPISTARTVLILRVLSEGLNICLASLIGLTLTLIMWTWLSRHEGLSISEMLALSPTTGAIGLLQLLFWDSHHPSALIQKLSIVIRFVLYYATLIVDYYC